MCIYIYTYIYIYICIDINTHTSVSPPPPARRPAIVLLCLCAVCNSAAALVPAGPELSTLEILRSTAKTFPYTQVAQNTVYLF